MTKYIGEYSYIITPDKRAKIYCNDKFKWESPPCENRAKAAQTAEAFIDAFQKKNTTLVVQKLSIDPGSFFGGKYHV